MHGTLEPGLHFMDHGLRHRWKSGKNTSVNRKNDREAGSQYMDPGNSGDTVPQGCFGLTSMLTTLAPGAGASFKCLPFSEHLMCCGSVAVMLN